jgi:protein phosphatase
VLRIAKAVDVSWLSRLRNWWEGRPAAAGPRHDPEATDEFATLSSLTLVPGQVRLRVGVVSVRGNYREHNEDNFYVPGKRSVRHDSFGDVGGGSGSGTGTAFGEGETMTLDPSNLFIVADGMGGQQAGEQASLMAVELIPRELAKRLPPDQCEPRRIQEAIREAVAEVNQEILGSSGTITEFSNMGTTVVLAQFRPDKVYVAGIGDSRAYRLRDGRLEQLTKDHSLADALVEAGTITREEAPTHKFKNVLYLYLGCKDARTGPEDLRVMDVHIGDRFLMASDGLTGVVSDDEIARVLGSLDDPQQAAVKLKNLALANDSKDNITCLVVHVVADAPPSGTP